MGKKNKFYQDTLNPVQQEAVNQVDGPVLVLAGAGSGKTQVLTSRIAHMIQSCSIPPEAILAVTFTNKATQEMKERVESYLGKKTSLWIGTFHSICARILRQETKHYAYDTDFVIYDEEDQRRLIKDVMKSLNISIQQFSPRAVAASISRAKNKMMTPADLEKKVGSHWEEIVARIFPAYQNGLRQNHAFDFDDLLLVPNELFTRLPDLLSKYQHRFSHILVDEYQDTNRAQYLLVRNLSDVHRNLFAVGDDDQSIYGWRGADIRNILDFEKDFPEARVFRLEQNYRSTCTILKASNSLISQNKDRKGKTLWSNGEEGDKVILYEAENEHQEAQAVVRWIQKEINTHKRVFSDFVILYRTNAQSRTLEDALRRSGMAYTIVGSVRFYQRKEIKDVLAYLKLIVNPHDNIGFKRIINFPLRGIGQTSIERLESFAAREKISLLAATNRISEIEEIGGRIAERIAEFGKLIDKYKALQGKISLNELVHTFIDEIGLLQIFKEEGDLQGQSRADNIRELLAAIDEYSSSAENSTLTGYLEEVSLVSDIDQWNETQNVITLMTLHCAKGLEFPVVFIAGLEEGLFPVYRSLDSDESLEEERRLMYVGMTRAKEKLYLLNARTRRRYEGSLSSLPSRFIAEIDSSCIRRENSQRQESPIKKRVSVPAGDIFSKDVMPDYESFSQEMPSISPGMLINHDRYGQGSVVSLEGRGLKQKITVRFQDGAVRKFIAQYAKFSIL